jgi:casein kinase 1
MNLRKLQQEQKPKGRYSMLTAYKIVIMLVERIEQLHSAYLVHNDLKLENIVIGIDDPSLIYLIDFGLTSSFVTDGVRHIEKEFMRNFSGNFLFASLNSCRGYNKSRRDDIESLFYMLIYLINDEYLPWCDLLSGSPNAGKPDLKHLLKERLNLKYTRALFSLIPSELTDILKKVLTLTFDEMPKYQVI